MNEIFDATAGAKTKKMYDEGDITAGVVECSQSVGLAQDFVLVQVLFDRSLLVRMELSNVFRVCNFIFFPRKSA